MTVVAEVKLGGEEEKQAGVLHSTIVPGVYDLYEKSKGYSPMLKSGLETVEKRVLQPGAAAVEARVPAEWVNKATEGYVQIDSMLTDTLSKTSAVVNERVVTPVTERVVNPVKETVRVVNEAVNDKVIEPVQTMRRASVDKVNQKVVEWKDLRGELSNKARKRLENGLNEVVAFSSAKGKDIIAIDLIAYSRTVLDNALDQANSVYEPAAATLATAVETAKATAASLQEAVSTHSAALKDRTVALAEPVREELKQKLAAAVAAARELSGRGYEYTMQKWGEIKEGYQEKMPADLKPEAIIARLPPSVQDALRYMISCTSPDRWAKALTDADIDLSKTVLENINALLSAVKEVVWVQPPEEAAASPKSDVVMMK